MAIIATYSEGHEKHGEIIDWARESWPALKQYEDTSLAFILFDLAEDDEPVKVLNFGPMTSHEFDFGSVKVECDRTYEQALIEPKKIEAE